MKPTKLFQCLLTGLCLFAGCQVADPNSVVQEAGSSGGLKLSDLEDTSEEHPNAEFLIGLRVLTYVLPVDSVDLLKAVFDVLSQTDIRCSNRDAFTANGLAIGTGKNEESAQISRKLSEGGAVRISQSRLLIPPDQTDILSSLFLPGGTSILYSIPGNRASEINLYNSNMGWIISARPDPRLPKMVQLNLAPAFWQSGTEDLRLRMGKSAIDFQPVEVGRVLARIGEGDFILLGPAGKLPDQTTLDAVLFFRPGRRPQVQFFVIICDKAGL